MSQPTGNGPYPRLDYNQISASFDQRYQANPMHGVASALRALIARQPAPHVLEAGCGTGHWLAMLRPFAAAITGLDLSLGMLQVTQRKLQPIDLVCAQGGALPFSPNHFDFIFCVNVFHHIQRKASFISQVAQLLKPGGRFLTIGMDPHSGLDQDYHDELWPETVELDLRRFASGQQIENMIAAAGLQWLERRRVEHIHQVFKGAEVLADPFLRKESTSQLTLLSDEAYQAGINHLQQRLAAGGLTPPEFVVDIRLWMTVAEKPV